MTTREGRDMDKQASTRSRHVVEPAGNTSPRESLLSAGRRHIGIPGLHRFSGLYLAAALFVLFAFWIPSSFYTVITAQSLVADQAVTAIVALAVMIPLTTATYDLSVGAMVGFSVMGLAWLSHRSALPIGVLAIVVVFACVVIGAVTATLVIRFRVTSLIATLAMGSVLAGLVLALSDGGQEILTRSGNAFAGMTQNKILGIPLPLLYTLGIAFVIWYILEQTPLGRFMFATGGNPDAARLTGIATSRMVVISLLASAGLAGIAGILLNSSVGLADPTIGPPLLLPAFAACFLGSTQIRPGRMNVWGTLLAVYVLAMGIYGFELAGANAWVDNVFYGVALAVAVAMAVRRGTRSTAPSPL